MLKVGRIYLTLAVVSLLVVSTFAASPSLTPIPPDVPNAPLYALADALGMSPFTLFRLIADGHYRLIVYNPNASVRLFYECTIWDNPCLGPGNVDHDVCWPNDIVEAYVVITPSGEAHGYVRCSDGSSGSFPL